MRNPTRIPLVLQLISDVWTMYPDLRFFQLMSVIEKRTNECRGEPHDVDLFYLEDGHLIKTLEKIKEDLEKNYE